MNLTLKNPRLINPYTGLDQQTDIHIQGTKIIALGNTPIDFKANKVIDATGLIACPGFVDLSVALREPGYTYKGTITSETLAAAKGGVTSLCCTPDTKPIVDTPAVVDLILEHARNSSYAKVYPVGALTKNFEGSQLSEMVALSEAGCIAFTNGLVDITNNRILRRALEYAATFDKQVIFTCQDASLAEDGVVHEGAIATFLGLAGIPETAETVALTKNLLLVEQTGVRAHFSQLTTARSVELIANAQARGLAVTADVAMYQLILTEEALIDFSSLYHVQPPLRTKKDREALREGVRSGVIQAIASHHRPQDNDAKAAPFAQTEEGISSVEILLPLAISLLEDGLLDLTSLLTRLTKGPANALNIKTSQLAIGESADIVLFDINDSTLVGDNWYSKGLNCPFMGHSLPAKVIYTLVDGRIVYQANQK